MKKQFILIAITLLVGARGFAQHDHNHSMNAPNGIVAPTALHGGQVIAGKNLNLEITTMKMGIALFPLTKKGEEMAIKDLKLVGVIKSQQNEQLRIPVTFSEMMNHFMVNFERRGTDPLELHVQATTNGKTESFVLPLN